MKISYTIFGLFIFSFFLSSCSILRPSEMFQVDEEYPVSSFEVSKKEYVIQPYDKVSVRVISNEGESMFGTGSMSGEGGSSTSQRNQNGFEFPVEFDGLIKLPIVGRIPISGMTVREAETYLEDLYGEFFVDPFVLVQVTNRKVMVFMNSGTNASIIEMPTENLTLIEAIAQAGGLTEISKSYKIKLIRGDLTSNPEVYYWNVSKLSELKNSNIFLEANDIIYVDSKPQYVYRILRELSPYLTLTTTIVTVYGVFFTLNKTN